MWLTSLLRLLHRSWSTLTTALGTTTLSLLLFSILLPMAPVAYRFWQQFRAGELKKQPFRSLYSIVFNQGSLALAALDILIWSGLAAWAVAATVYRDHRFLELQVAHLTLPPYSIAQNDEWASMMNLMMSVQYLRQPLGQQQPPKPCALKITAPAGNRVPAQVLARVAAMLGCIVAGPDYLTEDLAEARQQSSGALPDAIVVHGGPADPRVDGFAVDLSNIFEVKKSHDFSPVETPGLIWVQFGPGNVWRKGN